MAFNHRDFIAAPIAAAGVAPVTAMANPAPSAGPTPLGLDAAYLGVSPGQPGDVAPAIQRAIDQAAGRRCRWFSAPAFTG